MQPGFVAVGNEDKSGSIGAVTIKNSVAYGNGYLEDGTNAGNGNGFKLGGDNMSAEPFLNTGRRTVPNWQRIPTRSLLIPVSNSV